MEENNGEISRPLSCSQSLSKGRLRAWRQSGHTRFEKICKKHLSQMINLGSEMLRITPKGVEYSTSGGRVWSTRYMGTSCGSFVDLLPYGNEILAVTSKGIYYSSNSGRTWSLRYMGTSCGSFQNLMDGGKELLANTDKGLYYSTNGGRSWGKRR